MESRTLVTLLLLACVLCGCSSPVLYGKVEKIDRQLLASTAVRTPDPAATSQLSGQRLVVSWLIPPPISLTPGQWQLDLELVFANGSRERCQVAIETHWGHWEYELVGEPFKDRHAISAYQIKLMNGSTSWRVFQHKLYRPQIDLNQLYQESKASLEETATE